MQEPDLVRIVVNGASDHQCAAVQRIDTAGMTRQTTSNWWVVNAKGMASPNAWQIIIAMGIGHQHQDVNDTQEKLDGNREHLLSGDDRCSGEGQWSGEDQRFGED